jgi:EF-P beta-lysylation protein EpmB
MVNRVPNEAGCKPGMITGNSLAAKAGIGADDWRMLWRDAVTDPRELLAMLGLSGLAGRLPANGDAGFPLRVPRGFVTRMRHADPEDPLLRQVLPLDDECRILPGFSSDAVGDLASREAPGLLHKYAGRALLISTGSCAVHCRYCFRRHFPYGENTAAADGWRAVLAQIAADSSIREVLLSGGDPLSLATHKLATLSDGLKHIPHVRRLRLHTRLPVVLPERVDHELCQWLTGLELPVVCVIHVNHANEIDASVAGALARLASSGAVLLNQAVLLRGVNDSVEILEALGERLFECGVLPYYLHQLDRVQGAAHFEVSDQQALALHGMLRDRTSGYLLPRLVREEAGAASKRAL